MSQDPQKDSIPHQQDQIREWSEENVVNLIREFVDRGDTRRSDEKNRSEKIVEQGCFVPRTEEIKRPRLYGTARKRASLLARLQSLFCRIANRRSSRRQP